MEIKTVKNYLGEVIDILVIAKSEILSDDEPNRFSLSCNKFKEDMDFAEKEAYSGELCAKIVRGDL